MRHGGEGGGVTREVEDAVLGRHWELTGIHIVVFLTLFNEPMHALMDLTLILLATPA